MGVLWGLIRGAEGEGGMKNFPKSDLPLERRRLSPPLKERKIPLRPEKRCYLSFMIFIRTT